MLTRKADMLRDLLSTQQLIRGVGAGTALEARLIEESGFDLVWASSLCISLHNGVPDASLLSMTQYLEAARMMNMAVGIPVVADCDTGYGNANNVAFAVRCFEEAGIAGISIEDSRFPKHNSLLLEGQHELVPMEEFAVKLRAAKDAQQSASFLVIARVEALIAGRGQEEAHTRAVCYAENGADLILIHSKSSSSKEILDFASEWEGSAPLVVVPTTYPELTEDRISDLGKIQIVIYANQPARAAAYAITRLLSEIRAKAGIDELNTPMVDVQRLFELQGLPEMLERERRYLP